MKKKILMLMFISLLIFLNLVPVSINLKSFDGKFSLLADESPPVVTILNPTDTVIGDTVTIVINAIDESEITEYSILIDGEKRGNDTTYIWNTDEETEGSHIISARAKDELNLWGETNFSVIVNRTYESGIVKILNYNVLEGGIRRDNAWMDVVKEENPDILLAIETGTWDDNNNADLKTAINELNTYFNTEVPYKGYVTPAGAATEGAAILSRFPIVESKTIFTGFLDGDVPYTLYRELLHSVVEIGETYVHFLAVHFKCCGGTNEELTRELDMEAIINYMDALGPVPIIYTGDFNSFSPFDIGELASIPGNLGDGPISMLLNDSNPHRSTVHTWIDVYRELNPENPGYSYMSDFYKSRIDFIFVNEFFSDKLVISTVADTPSADDGSDHYAVDVTLNMDTSTSDIRPPLPPKGIDGFLISETSFNLTWTPNVEPDLSYYIVFRGDYILAEVNTTYFLDTQITSGIHYPYRVAAVDINGNIGFKSQQIIIEPSFGICSKPGAPILTGYPGDGETTLIWEINNTGGLPIFEFRVFRRFYGTPDGDVSIQKAIVHGSILGYKDTLNYNGNPANWIVKATNILGESDFSNLVIVTPIATADDAPPIPTTNIPTTIDSPPPSSITTDVPSSTTTTETDSFSSTSLTELTTETSSVTTEFAIIFSICAIPILLYRRRKR